MNTVNFVISNCLDCPFAYTEQIYTPDPFEHETGCYCSKTEDKNSYNEKHKLVAADDWRLENYTMIPDWCPYCNKKVDIKNAGDK